METITRKSNRDAIFEQKLVERLAAASSATQESILAQRRIDRQVWCETQDANDQMLLRKARIIQSGRRVQRERDINRCEPLPAARTPDFDETDLSPQGRALLASRAP